MNMPLKHQRIGVVVIGLVGVRMVAESIAGQLVRRVSFRRAMKKAMEAIAEPRAGS